MKNPSTSQNQKNGFWHRFREDFPWLCLLGVLFAACGWLVENTAKLIGSGRIDCRFHVLPFISPYSLIAFAFYLVLGSPDRLTFFGRPLFKKETATTKILSNFLCFLLIAIVVFVGELVVGNVWDALFGVELWNYNNHATHVTKYTSLQSALLFGAGGYLVFKLLFSPLLSLFRRKIPRKIAKTVGIVALCVIWLDTTIMGVCIAVFKKAPMYWSFKIY